MINKYYNNAYFGGKIIPLKNANISVANKTLQYGCGVFSGFRGYYNKKNGTINVFRINDHYKRMLDSLKILNARVKLSPKVLSEVTLDLIKKNKPRENFYVRPFAYCPSDVIAPTLIGNDVFEIAIYMMTMGDYLSVDKGLSVCVSSWHRVSDNALPPRGKMSGAYINSMLARDDAIRAGFDEAIFLSADGHVVEGSAENIFMVRDGALITPPKTADVLEGITRRSILEIAQRNDIETEERLIDRTELYIADEVFLTGTAAQVSWVKEIDKRKIGNGNIGPVTKKLQKIFFETVHGEVEENRDWITEIKI